MYSVHSFRPTLPLTAVADAYSKSSRTNFSESFNCLLVTKEMFGVDATLFSDRNGQFQSEAVNWQLPHFLIISLLYLFVESI